MNPTPYEALDAWIDAHFDEEVRFLQALVRVPSDTPPGDNAPHAERTAQLGPYVAAMERVRGREGAEAFRWLVEEFRVSLFAQELGTAEPVSAVKLDRALAALSAGGASTAREPTGSLAPPKPIVAVPLAQKKPAAIKNLNALDKLFGR